VCFFMNKQPKKKFIELDVDKTESDFGNQVENIFLKGGPDGDYEYFVRHYSGDHAKPVNFTIVLNQCGGKIDEGSAVVKPRTDDYKFEMPGVPGHMTKEDVHCLTLSMKKGKVTKAKFHIKTKNIPLE